MTHTEKLFLPIYIKEKEYKPQAVPDYGEGVNRQVDGRGKLEQTRETILTCVRKHAPIASQARHFPPYSGEADPKEKGIIVFIILYTHF